MTTLLFPHSDNEIANLATNLGTVEQVDIVDGFPAIEINHPNCTASISLYGGQVLNWQPVNEQEVFWLSDTSLYQQGKAIRGGIPLCWPWFGPLDGANQHGFAREVLWHLDSVDVTTAGVTVEISWQGEAMDKLWPYSAKLQQRLFFGKTFEQSLSMTNLSDNTIEYTGALHSYFKVSSPDNVTVPLLDEVNFYDKLADQQVSGLTRENCQGPIDTVYHTSIPQQLIDKGFGRIINIVNENTQQWVLWNPGIDTAAQMADVHQGGEQEYVCLEAANTTWQKIPAKQTAVIKQTITILPL